MNRFYKDCNGDGEVNCKDFMATHVHGGYGCNKPLPNPMQKKFEECQNVHLDIDVRITE